ncbi:DNA polymerase III, subunits gamma and tau (plasmid) [Gloeothece citriformis PCC 7424]|uniref:DNA polymerase III subunit gamma/tau n=1 Tax=Gloeothece citriformis (strain PCC 7424) TaxID=65393 RepID=B7KLR0_GLOC7|nr:DNA polymerase III subunit gamma/tau [Gloeothece citriformis]ACK73732.1 DNA polymerase III, subunits gamma and tau [Gloeothece citriformis PCC 7424]
MLTPENYQPLHLKYRPQQFKDLIGQELISRALKNAIASLKIANSYLFTGPRGTGKTSTARILAKALNCKSTPHSTTHPCGKCPSCQSIERGSSINVNEIDAASHNGVDDARSLIEQSHFAPIDGRYRVFILDECHMLTNQSQNALLKTIEETPPQCVFILCTTEPHKLLPTISSRCQTFNFKNTSLKTLSQHLTQIAQQENINTTPDGIKAIAVQANGGLRDGLQLLSGLSLLSCEITSDLVIKATNGLSPQTISQLVQKILTGQTLDLLIAGRELIEEGKTPQSILKSLTETYRDLLLLKSDFKCHTLISNSSNLTHLKQLADSTELEILDQGLQQLIQSEAQLKTNLNATVWLEICLLKLIPATPIFLPPISNHNGQRKREQQQSEVSPSRIWATVVEKVNPNNRRRLSLAALIDISEGEAVLKVPSTEKRFFTKNQEKIAYLISNLLGYQIQLIFKYVH